MTKPSSIINVILRSVIDYCLLPGTTHGTEIFILYARQWNKKLSVLLIALVTLLTMQGIESHDHESNPQADCKTN